MFSHAHPSGGRRTAGRFGTPVGGLALIALSASAVVSMARDPKPMTVALERQPGRVVVRIGGQPFTEYVFEGHAKPILFPILGPGGVPMTRSWPIVKDVPDEPHDHPHHESLWFTHGKVNGLDFWAHKADKEGRRPSVRQVAVTTSDEQGSIESRNEWVRQDGAVVMTDTRRIGFWGDADARGIDYDVTLHASHGPVTLGDTKEGTMALRVHHSLQLKDLDGSKGAGGRMLNSEGQRDAKVWGKPARWVDYSGTIDGRSMGIAMLDHPDNVGHPSHWHARDYGLFAANPFGLHDFTGAPPDAGNRTIPEGGTLRLRYRIVLHDGDATEADIDRRWREWARR